MHRIYAYDRFRLPLGALLVLTMALVASPVLAQQTLRISDEETTGTQTQTVEVLLSADQATEGFVLAISYPTAMVTVDNVSVLDTVTGDLGAELAVADVFDDEGGFTLGVVLDSSPPFDGQEILPFDGAEQVIATFEVTPDAPVLVETTVDITFEDGINDPPLDNILVQSGMSVGAGPDLSFVNGSFLIGPAPDDELFIADAEVPFNGTGAAEILMTNNSGEVQAFVLAISHDAGLILEDIAIDGTVTEDAGAEFVVATLHADGGTLAVVLDSEEPLDGQSIAMGEMQHIANYVYSCDEHPVEPAAADTFMISFEDGTFGTPVLDNVIVVDDRSVSPVIADTAIVSCLPRPEAPIENTEFFCGRMDAQGNIIDVVGAPGGMAEVGLFFSDPDDNIQGFQIGLTFDTVLNPIEDSFDIEDSILEAIGTEFVNSSVDNDLNDGDGIEMTVAILLDALPPFQDQMTPISAVPLLLGTFKVQISDDAECDSCYEINFTNGINGGETRDIDNMVVIDYESRRGLVLNSCNVCIDPGVLFMRGDCNGDLFCDLADVATALGTQFQGIEVGCEDACDAQDDGKVDLADSIYLLNFLFKSGPAPAPPHPVPGEDPTADNLTCEGGLEMCPE